MKTFHLDGNTIGFHPQTQKLELHTKEIKTCESTAEEVIFEWYHYGFHPQTQKLELCTK